MVMNLTLQVVLVVVLTVGISITVAVVGSIGWWIIKAMRRSREGASGDRGGTKVIPRPARAWPTILLVIVAAFVSYFWSKKPGGPSPLRGYYALGALAFIPVAWAGGSILIQVLAHLRNHREISRANKQALQGDIDGAIAGLVAVVNRRRERAPGTPPSGPWSPPLVSVGNDQRLANQLDFLGILETHRNHWAEALAWFQEAEQVGEQTAKFLANQGFALVKLGRGEEGVTRLRQAVAQIPPSDPANRSELKIQLATALIELGQTDEARLALDEAQAEWCEAVVIPAWSKKPRFAQIEALRDQLGANPN